jgi:uncharacterized protein (TIGR02246 family)
LPVGIFRVNITNVKVESASPPASRTPVELILPRALSAGDLESASACFARDACLITPDATVIHGRDRIRPLLAQLIAQRVEVEVELSHVVDGGEVRLIRERWRIRTGTEPARFAQTLHPTLVLRRVESEWRVAVAAPWGWAGGPL